MKKLITALTALFVAGVLPAQVNLDQLANSGRQMMEAAGIQLDDVQAKALAAFADAPEEVRATLQEIFAAFTKENYQQALGLFDKMRNFQLTPEQSQLWTKLKGDLSALVLERKFKYDDSSIKPLVDKAIASLKTADFEGAKATLNDLRAQASLSDEQEALLNSLTGAVAPATEKAKSWWSRLFG